MTWTDCEVTRGWVGVMVWTDCGVVTWTDYQVTKGEGNGLD